jgi:hypothetical protein
VSDPAALQRICDQLGPEQIDALLRKWRARLPHPFTPDDREAGYRYDISVLQAEFSSRMKRADFQHTGYRVSRKVTLPDTPAWKTSSRPHSSHLVQLRRAASATTSPAVKPLRAIRCPHPVIASTPQ